MRTQRVVADYLASRGFPFAESAGSARPGTDITGTPGVVWEVKARANLDPLAWVRQAIRNTRRGELPIVVFRPNGMGEDAGSYIAMLRLDHCVTLLQEAAYADEDGTSRPNRPEVIPSDHVGP